MNFFKTTSPHHLGKLQLILAMFFAGSTIVLGKILTATLPIFLISFLTLLVAFTTLLPATFNHRKTLRKLSPRQWMYISMQGLCGIVLFRILTLYGLKYTGAVEAGLILGTTPAVLTILSAIFLKELPGLPGLMGISCAVFGMMFLNLASAETTGPSTLMGCLFVFGAVVVEAAFTVFRKKIAGQVDALPNTIGLTGISLVLVFPFAVNDYFTYGFFPGLMDALAILYYGIFGTVIAYLLWTNGVGKVSSETAGIATAAMPLSSVLLGALMLHEPLGRLHLIGCIMVVTGIVFNAIGQRTR